MDISTTYQDRIFTYTWDTNLKVQNKYWTLSLHYSASGLIFYDLTALFITTKWLQEQVKGGAKKIISILHTYSWLKNSNVVNKHINNK